MTFPRPGPPSAGRRITCLSIQTPQQDTGFTALRDFWQAADSLGFHAAYTFDHLVPLLPGEGPQWRPAGGRTGTQLEGWSVLAALGTATRRLKVGTLVTDVTLRPAPLLVKMAVTLDHLTGGRAILGVGAGWHAEEHRMFGIPFPAASGRLDLLEEALETAAVLLADRTPARSTNLAAAYFEPKAVQRRLPVLVGGSGRRTRTLAARHADVLNTFAPAAAWPALHADLDQLLVGCGRRPEQLRRSAYVFADLSGQADREARLVRLVAERSGISRAEAMSRIVVADPARAARVLHELTAADVDEVVLGLTPPYDPAALERFAVSVLPELNTLPPAGRGKDVPCST